MTQLDIPANTSSGGNEASGRGRGGESKEGKDRCWEEAKKQAADGEPEQRSQQHQGPEAPNPDEHCIFFFFFFFLFSYLQGHCKNQREAERQEIIEEECNGVTETLMRAVGTDWSELDETVKTQYSQSGPRPLQAILKKWKTEVVRAEENKCGESFRKDRIKASNRMGLRQEDNEFKALDFDSTLGYSGECPPRVPDLGPLERCNDCDLTPWRASRGGKAGKCEKCKNVRKKRHGDGEVQVCDVPQP